MTDPSTQSGAIAAEICHTLRGLGDLAIAEHSQRFFKTGKGEYGEGDRFLGIRVPVVRRLVKRYRDIPIAEVLRLLKSPFHEVRLFALLNLVEKYARGGAQSQNAVYSIYLAHTRYINNWDLVDCSAGPIVGAHLEKKDKRPLYQLTGSGSLWERRIAIMATFYLIRNNRFEETFEVSRLLLGDKEDLIHKAVGWMLREVGKRDPAAAKAFLKVHFRVMPRTMLRYAIEKYPASERQRYLQGTVLS